MITLYDIIYQESDAWQRKITKQEKITLQVI